MMSMAEKCNDLLEQNDRPTAELAKSREQAEMLAQESAAFLTELAATKAALEQAQNQRQRLVDLATNVCALNGGEGLQDAITELARAIGYPGY